MQGDGPKSSSYRKGFPEGFLPPAVSIKSEVTSCGGSAANRRSLCAVLPGQEQGPHVSGSFMAHAAKLRNELVSGLSRRSGVIFFSAAMAMQFQFSDC
jgi:hypothetical protein